VVTARTTVWLLSPISTQAAWMLASTVAGSGSDEPPQPAMMAAAASVASVAIVRTVRVRRT